MKDSELLCGDGITMRGAGTIECASPGMRDDQFIALLATQLLAGLLANPVAGPRLVNRDDVTTSVQHALDIYKASREAAKAIPPP